MSRSWTFAVYAPCNKPAPDVIETTLQFMLDQYGFRYANSGVGLVRGLYKPDTSSLEPFEVPDLQSAILLLSPGGGWIDLWRGDGYCGIQFDFVLQSLNQNSAEKESRFYRVLIDFDLGYLQEEVSKSNELLTFFGDLGGVHSASYGFGTDSYMLEDEEWEDQTVIYRHITSGQLPAILWNVQYLAAELVDDAVVTALKSLGADIKSFPHGILATFAPAIGITSSIWLANMQSQWAKLSLPISRSS